MRPHKQPSSALERPLSHLNYQHAIRAWLLLSSPELPRVIRRNKAVLVRLGFRILAQYLPREKGRLVGRDV